MRSEALGQEGKARSRLPRVLRSGPWPTLPDAATPAPAGGACVELGGWTTENQDSSAGLTFTKGLILTKRGRRDIFKIKQSKREKLNLILKGAIRSPK